MSTIKGTREVRCDGEGCTATTRWPIGLRPSGANVPGGVLGGSPGAGWLCVEGRLPVRHYCPRCAARYLGSLGDGEPLRRPRSAVMQRDTLNRERER